MKWKIYHLLEALFPDNIEFKFVPYPQKNWKWFKKKLIHRVTRNQKIYSIQLFRIDNNFYCIWTHKVNS